MDVIKYFHASATGSPPVMAPAGFRLNLLDCTHFDMHAANRGLIQMRYNCGSDEFTIQIGLAKRFQSNSTMLRVVTVFSDHEGSDHRREGMILEGDPLGDSFGTFDRNPTLLRQMLDDRNSETLDKCYRLLAGLFNALRALGIVHSGNNVPYKRLLGFLSSQIMVAAMGTFLKCPTSGFENLMDAVVKATGPRDQPIKLADIHLNRYYIGGESKAMTLLNGFIDRSTTTNAWKIMRDLDRDPAKEYSDSYWNLGVVSEIGDFSTTTDQGVVSIDRMSSIKSLDALIRRDRSMLTVWISFLARIFEKVGAGRIIGMPVGQHGNVLFLIGAEIWSDMFSSVYNEEYDPDGYYRQGNPARLTLAGESTIDSNGDAPETCEQSLPE